MGHPAPVSALGFDRLVLWGLRDECRDLSYIMAGFRHAAERIGIEVTWVNDLPESAEAVTPGALVFAYNGASEHVPSVAGARYLLHNLGGDRLLDRLPDGSWLLYQVYTDDLMTADGPAWGSERWDLFTFFHRSGRALFQPWGTDLLPDEHLPPTWPAGSRVVHWVGSVWDNELGQGNERMITELRAALDDRFLTLVHHQGLPASTGVRLVRESRVAPAFAGQWQADNGYLPCRLFKNVSYGQLGVTNVGRFRELLGDTWVSGESVAEQLDRALSMGEKEYVETTRAQQELVAPYNYERKLRDVARGFEECI